jgi:hypothetical protein
VLDSYEEPAAPPPEAPPAWSQPASTYVEAQAGPFPAPSPEGREAWFRRVAHDRLLPMLDDIVLQAREHGQSAEYELHTPDGRAQYRIEVQRADHPPGQPLPYMAFACGEENDVALLYGGTVPGPQDHNGADTEIGWREVSWGEVEPALVKFAQRLFRR